MVEKVRDLGPLNLELKDSENAYAEEVTGLMPNPDKPKVAFYWCASCGGCEEAVVDLAEAILDVVAAVDIVFWPVAMDFKRKDVESMADGSITATFLNGAIRTTEQESMARLLRSKSQLLVALGSCSHLGGIPGLANLFDRASIMQEVYVASAKHDKCRRNTSTNALPR